MTRAFATLRPGHAAAFQVPEGGVIGRGLTASGRVLDPGVSEAHAMVTRRGLALRLLSLRGTLWVDGEIDDDIDLIPGLRVSLTPTTHLDVVAIEVPRTLAAVCIDGGSPQPLCASLYALTPGPPADLVVGERAHAVAHLLPSVDGWWLARPGTSPARLALDEDAQVGAIQLRLVEIDAGQADLDQRTSRLGLAAPLTLVNRFTAVHVHRHRRESIVIDALPGRLLSELAAFSAPAPWSTVAGELWPGVDGARLRMRWDRALQRLRGELQAHGIREDLVRLDGRGNVEVFLLPGDRVVDET